MKVTYSADDGYVGKNRPLTLDIPDDEIMECDSVDDAMDFIDECITDDFQQRVLPSYSDDKIRVRVAELFNSKSE